MDINTYFDKIYYINIDKDVDRNNNILSQLNFWNIYNYKRFSPNLITSLPEKYLYRNFIKHENKYILGQLGCRDSHIKIIKECKELGYKNVLILEDDIIIKENPSYLLKSISNHNWDMLYFGGLIEPYFRGQIVQTHAYAVSNKLFDDIIFMAEHSGMEIDNFYAKIIQQMSYNYNKSGRYYIEIVKPFNTIIQSSEFESNII